MQSSCILFASYRSQKLSFMRPLKFNTSKHITYLQLHCGQASRFGSCKFLCIISSCGHNLSVKLKLQLPPLLGTAVSGQWQSLSVSLGLFMPQRWCQQEADQEGESPCTPLTPLQKTSSLQGLHFAACLSSHIQPLLLQRGALARGNRNQSPLGNTENKNLQYHSLPTPRSSLFTQLVLRCSFLPFFIAKEVVPLLPPEVRSTERRTRIFFASVTVCLWWPFFYKE